MGAPGEPWKTPCFAGGASGSAWAGEPRPGTDAITGASPPSAVTAGHCGGHPMGDNRGCINSPYSPKGPTGLCVLKEGGAARAW